MLDYINYTDSFFFDYSLILFENDSQDKTVELLREYQKIYPKLMIKSERFNLPPKKRSIKFLATARNFYLKEISKSQYVYYLNL